MLTAVVIIYLTLVVIIGTCVSRRVKKASDFLIAGRNLGLVLTTATLAAVQLGAGVILGGAELGAGSGIWPGMWYGIGCGGGLILAGFLVASKLRKRGGFVPLDFFADRYGEMKLVRIWGWLSNIPSLLGIFVVQIMAAGSIISIFGFDETNGIILIGAVILLYSIRGGMWGVVAVDFAQICIIMIGIPLVAVVTIMKLEDPGAVTEIFTTPFIPSGMFTKAVFVIIPFLLSISVSYDAFMRYQSAKSGNVAKWGCILGGIVVILISFCVGLIGSAGKILFPGIENGAVLPHMIKASLHPVAAGIVVSALLAAVMSTANCLLISLSGCFSRDLYNKVFNPGKNLDDLKHTKLISRSVIIGVLVCGTLIAFHTKGIIDTIIIFNYPYMGSMLVPLLGGVMWKGGTTRGAIAAMFAGGTIGLVSFFVGIPWKLQGLFNIDLGLFTAYTVSTLVYVTVSKLTSVKKIKENRDV